MVSTSSGKEGGGNPIVGKSEMRRIGTKERITKSVSSTKKGEDANDDLIIKIPPKVDFGEGASAKKQFIFLLGILFFLLQMGIKAGGMIKIDETKRGKYRRMLTSPMKAMKVRKELLMQDIMAPLVKLLMDERRPRSEEDLCDLYLGPSSIPDSGWGMFAGKNYAKGDLIKTDFSDFLPPFFSGDKTNKDSLDTLSKSPLAFLLKPHSLLHNVEWGDASSLEHSGSFSALVASRDITEGEEFFLSLLDHPYWQVDPKDDSPHTNLTRDTSIRSRQYDYVFAHTLPSLQDFSRADDVIRDSRLVYFGTSDIVSPAKAAPEAPKRSSNARWNQRHSKRNKNSIRLYNPDASMDIDKGLQLLKQTISKYDPSVARLLPARVQKLASYHHQSNIEWRYPSLLGALNNQTVTKLSKNAQCLSHIQVQHQQQQPVERTEAFESEQNEGSCPQFLTDKRVVVREGGFRKGDVVDVVPLLIVAQFQTHNPSTTKEAIESSCSVATRDRGECLPLPNQRLAMCPLSFVDKQTNDRNIANVEYRWSNRTVDSIPPDMQLLMKKASSPSLYASLLPDEEKQVELLWEKYALSMAWDIVALRDLKQNETVMLYQPNGIPIVKNE